MQTMAGDREPKVPGGPEEDTLGGQRVTREDPEVPARWPRSFPGPAVSRGPWPLLLLLFLALAICFLLLVTTLVQVSRIPKSPPAEAQDPQESPSLVSASQEQVHSGLEQIRQQLGQINASLARLCRPCPWNWEPFQGSCYLFSRTLGVWEASVSSCRDLGAHLVIVNSLAEQRFLRYWDVRKDQRTWIGLRDRSRQGSWQWVDGAPLQLSFWRDGEPSNDGDEACVELFQDTWSEKTCTAQNFWVCEQPVVPCPGL